MKKSDRSSLPNSLSYAAALRGDGELEQNQEMIVTLADEVERLELQLRTNHARAEEIIAAREAEIKRLRR